MKDLKHLNYFENLLQDSGNELVDKARAAGSICIGTTCYQIPEVLLNLTGCFAVRMRAPRTGSMEMGTYYMTSLNCEFARALLERCLEGGYGFLDCIIEPFACSQMTSTMENIEKLHLCDKDKPDFFVQHVDTPIKADENAVRHLTRMCRARILEKLHETFGTDVSDAALRDAVMRYKPDTFAGVRLAGAEHRPPVCSRLIGADTHPYSGICRKRRDQKTAGR